MPPSPFPRPASVAAFAALVQDLPPGDAAAAAAAAERQAGLTKPTGSLGRLEDLVAWLCRWQGRHPPRLEHVSTLVFAGNHGVAARGVSAFAPSVTAEMVANFAAGGAAINQLTRAYGSDLQVVPLALHRPTDDFCTAPALDDDGLLDALSTGWQAVAAAVGGAEDEGPGRDLLLIGEMGIANTTAAAALAAGLFGGDAADWVGPGTGVDGDGVRLKTAVVDQALALHRPAIADTAPEMAALETLRRLGGRELAAMCGAVLAARLQGVPVLLDGFVCAAAAAVLHRMAPDGLAHCVAGHVSAEPGHARLLGHLGLRPLLALDMRLGEASGAAVALGVVRGALAAHTGMHTFDQARVTPPA